MSLAQFLDPDVWQTLTVNYLHTLNDDGSIWPRNLDRASEVYRSKHTIPSVLVCRTSQSSKRLGKGIETSTELKTPWGNVIQLTAGGTAIGVAMDINRDLFRKTYLTPDGGHLLSSKEVPDEENIVRHVYEYKTFRVYSIGPLTSPSEAQDLMVTAKLRWFRNRYDPKYLGFSKDKS